MVPSRSNIVLIGMPGSGKSTVGPLLAERLSLAYLDTDLLIAAEQGREFQSIVDRDGYQELRRIEERTLLRIYCDGHVIATGGSAVYSAAAMAHLQHRGAIFFLEVQLDTLIRRVDNEAHRGLVRRPGQSLADLYAERLPLYRRYADFKVNCAEHDVEEICSRICAALGEKGGAAALGAKQGPAVVPVGEE